MMIDTFNNQYFVSFFCSQLQMVQFILVMGHSAKAIIFPNCWPMILAVAELLHAILFFNMFFQFYRRVYWGEGAAAHHNNNNNNNRIKNGDATPVREKIN